MFGLESLLGSWTTSCFIGFVTIVLIYWFSIKNHGYWKQRNVPFVKPLPFIGSELDVFRKSTHEIEYERYFKYGPIYGYFEGSMPSLSVADPTLVRDLLVKDFSVFPSRRIVVTGNEIFDKMLNVLKGGEDWKRIRSIVSPTFTTGKIKRMMGIFKDCSETVVKNFRTAVMDGKPIDAKRLYGAFTMDIIASSAFSTKIDSHNDPDNQFVSIAKAAFTQALSWRGVVFMCCPSLLKIFKIDLFPGVVMEFFKSVTLQIIEERKKTGQVRNDFLQLLMDTAIEVADEQKWDIPEKDDIASNYKGQDQDINHQIFKTVTSKNLSLNELVAQSVVFFIAGYDTTGSALSFATYLLALNPDIQDRLRAEVDEALKQSEGEVTYEAIQSMKYLDNVISETLRIYAPISRLDRIADSDYKLGDTGITIPKGMLITVPVHAMHRDPKLYPNPDKFYPDRFTPEEKAKRDPYSYLPFGAGPRNCVATRFALLEVKVCLAYVIANFIVKRCPETKVPLQFNKSQGLLKPKEIIVEMEIRKDSPLSK